MLDLSPFRPLRLGAGKWSPASLFSGGAQGLFLDPSILSSMSQDTAGLTPVTGPGQSVGRALDRSGRGNHATQATAAAKPTLGRHPRGGRRNLILKNDFGFVPLGALTTDQQSNGFRVYALDVLARGMTVTCLDRGVDAEGRPYIALRIAGTNSGALVTLTCTTYTQQPMSGTICVSSYFTLLAGSGTGITVNSTVQIFNGASFVRAAGSSQSVPTATELRKFNTTTLTAPENAVNVAGAQIIIAAGATVDATIRVSGVQMEAGATPTAVQRVLTQYDVTEAGVPDAWYMYHDPAGDWLATPSITWGTDEVTIIAAVRKDTDAGNLILAEYSPSVDSNNGSFFMANTNGLPGYRGRSRGTTGAEAGVSTGAPAGAGHVVRYQGKISTDLSRLWINGAQVATTSADQGTGNYGNYSLYVGARGAGSLPFVGNYYGLIAINRVLTDAELARVERHFASRTGVNLA